MKKQTGNDMKGIDRHIDRQLDEHNDKRSAFDKAYDEAYQKLENEIKTGDINETYDLFLKIDDHQGIIKQLLSSALNGSATIVSIDQKLIEDWMHGKAHEIAVKG